MELNAAPCDSVFTCDHNAALSLALLCVFTDRIDPRDNTGQNHKKVVVRNGRYQMSKWLVKLFTDVYQNQPHIYSEN